MQSNVSFLRLVAEGTQMHSLAAGMNAIPSIQLGIRQYGRNSESVRNIELTTGFELNSPFGLNVSGSNTALFSQCENLHGIGTSGSVNYDRGSDGLGIQFSLSQDWNKSIGTGNGLLWSRSILDNADGEPMADVMNFESEIGYGFEVRDGLGRMIPYGGGILNENRTDHNLGGRFSLGPYAEFSIEGSRIGDGQREPTRKYRIGGKLGM